MRSATPAVSQLPDAATLDALVIGTDESDDRAAWEALVRLPGGAEAWHAAVTRRRRIDLLASAMLGRSWLASCVHRLSVLSRRVRAKPPIRLLLGFPDVQLDALAGATLGPVDEEFADQDVQPRWGETVPVRVRLGDRITLNAVADDAFVDVRYLSDGRDGSLPGRTWRLEQGEAPVLLVALVGADARSSLTAALTQATAAAGVLLLEATPIRGTST
jgi:hypothetical protein